MQRLASRINLHFSTKVLVPIVLIMVLLVAITAWTINHRLTQRFQAEAAQRLATADAVFRNSLKIHTKNLLTRFRNLPNEPRYRAAFLNADLPTLKAEVRDLPRDQDVDVVLFTSARGELLASEKRDPLIPLGEFETNSALTVRLALNGEEKVDTIRVGERLFDVVSIPVTGPSGGQIGALTFGSEIGDSVAQEFSLVTQSKLVLLANERVIASTVPATEPTDWGASLFHDYFTESRRPDHSRVPKQVLLGDEHYFCSGGLFASASGENNLGYLLLSSYEQPLRALHSTQELLLLVSSSGILLGTGVVWFLVRRVTRPLRLLRDSAEAVGRGDFSRRVEVTSGDECGELAAVFNQMTENLKVSREELVQTVERLKTTQAQLVQSEKLSGIGEFVAGVAHELNNPLTSVMGFSELLKQADTNPQHQRYLELIYKSSVRCQKIVQNLLSFARRHPPERKLSSVNSLVEAAVEFLQYQLRTNNIEVVTRLDPNLPQVMVDPHQVQQVFLNIINNARQAIEANQPTGRIQISTETAGDKVRILFEDNGPGIPQESISKVFDPFFTTKPVGKGTGLGLSLCYGIIHEHGGSITVRSQPGQGATFTIELPLAAGEPNRVAPRDQSSSPAARNRQATGKRILVIDDEDAILQMVRETLSGHGFEVDVARDGESALRRLKVKPYDLALCDWKMPGLNGAQVYERLRIANPSLSERVIFITGDVINDKAQKFLQDHNKVCLSKPFSLDEFCAAVDKALTA
jgi:signal transduction histidine kinase/CheY-like chemotaxis protein